VRPDGVVEVSVGLDLVGKMGATLDLLAVKVALSANPKLL
jgi:hypothetical protein